MTPERFREVAAVFDEVADAPEADRPAVLDRLAGADVDLRREVEALMARVPGRTRIGDMVSRAADHVAQQSAALHIDERYEVLGKLGEGGMGVVYRARDRLTGRQVALKRVRVALVGARELRAVIASAYAATHLAGTTSPGLASGSQPALMALAREFHTLASIRHPHIISVLDYGFGPTREPFFTMELLADATPLLAATVGRPLALRVRLLLQVLEALTYVHRRGVLHRDLKPANVLVVPHGDDLRAKVLDFGIACVRDPHNPEAVAGTIGYMAPELFLGAPPSESSDLWAVAVMALEVLLGTGEPRDPTTVPTPDDDRIPPALAAVLRRALDPDPARRHPDAPALARDLAAAADLPPPAETAETRDSLLSAAAFVARRRELLLLRQALRDATAGRGSLWLVGGESGVGKSRLLDELRTLALVGGARVTRGQAVHTGGAALQVWQGALRPLCLHADLDDADASLLRLVIPDLETLLDRTVADPPETDLHSAEARLVAAIDHLLAAQQHPHVLLLEDLHWADPASIRALQRLSRDLADRPILIVATYRDDERASLPADLPLAARISLTRLAPAEVAELSRSMLGPAGADPALVALLARESEGNPFFIVEALRSLAEEAGALARIAADHLPAHITAGGIQAVLQRRLARVPARARALLTAAAVLGRELDLAVLAEIPDLHLDDALAAGTAAAVLEVDQDTYRFTHDTLRRELLAHLPAGERRTWHRRVGVALEHVHAADLGPHAAALAHHFAQSDDPPREAHYRILAGEQASRRGAVADAISHLERARLLLDRLPDSPDRAHASGLLVRAYHGAGRFTEASDVVERMFADLGHPPPHTALGLAANVVRRLGQRALHRVFPGLRRQERDPSRLAAITAIGEATNYLAEGTAFVHTPGEVLSGVFDLAALAERSPDPIPRIAAYASLWYIAAASPLADTFPAIGDAYLRRTRVLLDQLPPARADVRAYVHMMEATLHAQHGRFDRARASLEAELELRRRMADWRGELLALTQALTIATHQGDLAAVRTFMQRSDDTVARLGSTFWGLAFLRGQLAARAGHLLAAEQLLADADALLARTAGRSYGTMHDSLGAACAVRRGDRETARRRADAAVARLRTLSMFNYGMLELPAGALEAHTELWSTTADPRERTALAAQIRRGLAVYRRFAAAIPITRPRALLWHAAWSALRGHPRRAARRFDAALAAATSLRMPFEQALVHAAIARHLPARAATHRPLARALFDRLDAPWHRDHLDTP